MSDPSPSLSEDFAGGAVTVEATPVSTGTIEFSLYYDSEQMHSTEMSRVLEMGQYPEQQRATLRNKYEEQLDGVEGIDAEQVAAAVKTWLDGLKSQNSDVAVGPLAREIISGTRTPVEIREAPDENTTWHVELEYSGRTRELEFAADDLIGDSSGLLASKLIHNYHERVDVTEEDWDEIADYWHANSEVVDRTNVTAKNEIAERVLSFMADRVEPATERENIANSPATAYLDVDNDAGAMDTDGPVLWVRDALLTDEMETAGKDVSYKGQLVADLKQAGNLHDTPGEETSRRPRSWTEGSSRIRVWAFEPEAVGVDAQTDGGSTGPAHSEVEP